MTEQHNFKKKYGQNFLSDEELLNNIANDAEIQKNDTVLEIGAGSGALTKQLASRAKRVVAYEIDKELKPLLDANLASYNNVQIVFEDFMRQNILELEQNLGDDYIVAANLPYYVSSPVVMLFAEKASKIKRLVLTLQKEVGARLAAKPNTADYGAVTVALNVVAEVKLTRFIDRTMFYPQPNVDSVVVRADFCGNRFGVKNFADLRSIVRTAFAQRRKTLANNLICAYGVSRQKAEEWLSLNNVDLKARGETLSPSDFARLSNTLSSLKS